MDLIKLELVDEDKETILWSEKISKTFLNLKLFKIFLLISIIILYITLVGYLGYSLRIIQLNLLTFIVLILIPTPLPFFILNITMNYFDLKGSEYFITNFKEFEIQKFKTDEDFEGYEVLSLNFKDIDKVVIKKKKKYTDIDFFSRNIKTSPAKFYFYIKGYDGNYKIHESGPWRNCQNAKWHRFHNIKNFENVVNFLENNPDYNFNIELK